LAQGVVASEFVRCVHSASMRAARPMILAARPMILATEESEDPWLESEETMGVPKSRPRLTVAKLAVFGLAIAAAAMGFAVSHSASPGARPLASRGPSGAILQAAEAKPCSPDRMSIKPSLFCFAVMMANSSEEALLKNQLEKRVGMFSCNAYVVISKAKRWLGQDECEKDVWSWEEGLPDLARGHCDLASGQSTGCTNSFLNTNMFQIVWDSLVFSNMLWDHDWIVKMDPDTVFLADRLRTHLTGQTGEPYGLVQDPSTVEGDLKFMTTCWYNAPTGLMYGSLEVFTMQAIKKYSENNATCKNLDWSNWGEDLYMQSCMEALQVPSVHDYHLIGDDNCEGLEAGDCSDPAKAAYHPRKDVDSWNACHDAATR